MQKTGLVSKLMTTFRQGSELITAFEWGRELITTSGWED